MPGQTKKKLVRAAARLIILFLVAIACLKIFQLLRTLLVPVLFLALAAFHLFLLPGQTSD